MWHHIHVKTLRRPLVLGILLLAVGVVWTGWSENVMIAAYVLAAGLVVLALARLLLPPKHTLNARGRTFDVVALLSFAAVLVVLAPSGLATLSV